ncbi:DEAD/DEAH box helicase [Mariniblastus sp.]|nr:DEAD/DEAH box helicase [Mariniblastus sp.]
MSNFELLHPALQHHIVNALGWRSLRPFQDDLIPSIMEGQDHIVLAPTAGGKTEAAFFPLLTRMASEEWQGLSVLYICPLRALLNNLHDRVVQYSGFVGRRAGVWHGDILQSDKKAMLREPPEILMTTPESLEGILISPNKDHREFLSNVRAIVVDEIHAFASGDRGWHMLFVLQRILEFSKHDSIQRIGLSATVGNPEFLLDWLQTGNERPSRIYTPTEPATDDAEITVDYVATLDNAATIISRMHRGEKRLVFIDSRSNAEQLGKRLRELEVDVYVTHGSLSREQRLFSEQAFQERFGCVIVATSVLELGVDIGSLDRVIQIGSPNNVAGFLQRMGRTGRRPGTQRNCLFLTQDSFPPTLNQTVKTCALVDLWRDGHIESAFPPENPMHIVAQQLMALCLQNHGIGRDELIQQISPPLAATDISLQQVNEIVDWMLEEEMLFEDTGIVSLGRSGEEEFGRRHFLDLVSVFSTPPMFKVFHGRQEVGEVDPLTFIQMTEEPGFILLAGRSWLVNHVDWRRWVAHVEPARAAGKSRWAGASPLLSYELCQSYKNILASDFTRSCWSNRTAVVIEECRRDYDWLVANATVLTLGDSNHPEWWTFAGSKGNTTLAAAITSRLDCEIKIDPFFLRIQSTHSLEEIQQTIAGLSDVDWNSVTPAINDGAVAGLKFNVCLADRWARMVLQDRLKDVRVAKLILEQDLRLRIRTP